ncbi:efflux RND transporter periplasmic adaptor subunit [Jannaschia donghaensis]|uniref:Putative efflux pump membrane fusion protein n=1 Tax=Jannaschia donghaensis TaxID=420998 RepID=A0A0M6YLL9_9RHOB|nr:efflux RND transporter periplasmic adaptor subunit [Jannaschia donghaensis]CTQ51258.1 putative efflux pump membrane fusion protein [Jannaschia donghaensis]
MSRRNTFAAMFVIAISWSSLTAVAQSDVTPSGDPVAPRAVRLIAPLDASEANSRRFFGRIAARETVSLSFEVGGRLVDFPILEGSAVPKGSTLARLDQEPFVRAQERAVLALEQAERDAERAGTLAASNVTSEVRAQDARTARDLADVALRDAREAVVDAVLTAPFDGIVAARIAETFSNVEPGQPILRLHDMSQVRVEIEVPERVLLNVGDPEAISFSGTLPNKVSVDLKLVEFEAQTGRVGQSFRVALAIPDAAASGLIPGSTMTVVAQLPQTDSGAILPQSAILAEAGGGFEVMVFRPGEGTTGTIERRAVRVFAPRGKAFEVEGLKPGERIVAAGGHLLRDGETVRIYDGLTVEEP